MGRILLLFLAGVIPTVVPATDGVITLGDVEFPHEMHYDALELECVHCHHETDAPRLAVPHEQYFADLWHKCESCHHKPADSASTPSCRSCHPDSPADIADETLSAKVVIHRSCWSCHEVGVGREAASSCKTCHSKRAA